MTEFNYDRTLVPPAPSIELEIISHETQLVTEALKAIVDTGADATFVPLAILEGIQAPVGEPRFARSVWGDRHRVLVFIVDMQIGELTFSGVQVVGYEGAEIIIGRDVLNKIWLLLAGPEQMTELWGTRPSRIRR